MKPISSPDKKLPLQWRSQDFEVGGATWRARSASLYGGLGAEPPAGSRGRAPGQGVRGRSPPEAGDILCFNEYDFRLNLLHEKHNQIAISSH
jgi:hypothetical protein